MITKKCLCLNYFGPGCCLYMDQVSCNWIICLGLTEVEIPANWNHLFACSLWSCCVPQTMVMQNKNQALCTRPRCNWKDCWWTRLYFSHLFIPSSSWKCLVATHCCRAAMMLCFHLLEGAQGVTTEATDTVPMKTNQLSLLSFPEAAWGQPDAELHRATLYQETSLISKRLTAACCTQCLKIKVWLSACVLLRVERRKQICKSEKSSTFSCQKCCIRYALEGLMYKVAPDDSVAWNSQWWPDCLSRQDTAERVDGGESGRTWVRRRAIISWACRSSD